MPNAGIPGGQMYMQGGAPPMNPFYAQNPQMQPWMRQFGQPGVAMHMNGFAGYPGMYPGQIPQFQWQQVPINAQNVNPPRIHRVQINLRLVFTLIVVGIALLSQSGAPNWYLICTLLAMVAFMNGWIPGLGPRAQRPAAAQANNGAAGAAGQGQQAAAQGGAAAQGAPQNAAPNAAVDDPDREQLPPEQHVPALLRYDWRHHTGVVGEVLGFVCPLVFSLWPSWDPSILGDHPDIVRRQQQEAAAAAAAAAAREAPQDQNPAL